MQNDLFQSRLEKLFDSAGISVDGKKPWDIRIHDPRVYRKTVLQGNLGFGESYMDGWWDCDDLDELFFRILSTGIDNKVGVVSKAVESIACVLWNMQRPSRAFTVGKRHYDAGNDLFKAMLDRLMIYSCALWGGAGNLDEAQENKLRLCFDKLDLEPGMKLLDIGCGWGGTAKFAAENFGAKVVAVTISKEQAELAADRCRNLDVEIQLKDYRSVEGKFDRIVSLGMFEHVGYKNYRTFFETARRCLKPEGRLLVQTIGSNEPSSCTDPWIERYIFPNSMLPSASQITASYENKFVLEDWHSFSYDYALTLKAWERNVTGNWARLKNDYDEKFYRMWRYYLLSCSGAFRARTIQLWQVLLSPTGIRGECSIPHEPAYRQFRDKENGHRKRIRTPVPSRVQRQESPRSGAASES
ncbi:MAG: cyclopropane fatty acyl phospholipid synthase [Chlorobiaceae bacterium]|nr:cyclopropane fatty acyl phospholipid synthase [Chlorobiaceae bacterium]